jgi:hypothetical protein
MFSSTVVGYTKERQILLILTMYNKNKTKNKHADNYPANLSPHGCPHFTVAVHVVQIVLRGQVLFGRRAHCTGIQGLAVDICNTRKRERVYCSEWIGTVSPIAGCTLA